MKIGLVYCTNTTLQSAIYCITVMIPFELAIENMKEVALKSYGAKGQDAVDKSNTSLLTVLVTLLHDHEKQHDY